MLRFLYEKLKNMRNVNSKISHFIYRSAWILNHFQTTCIFISDDKHYKKGCMPMMNYQSHFESDDERLRALELAQKRRLEQLDRAEIEGTITPEETELQNRLRMIVLPRLQSEEQVRFYFGQLELAKIAQIEKDRGLTRAEEDKQKAIKQDLFQHLYRFAMSMARKRLTKYRVDSDAYSDILQSCCEIFLENLPKYRPLYTTPTTYFVSRFHEVITHYVIKDSQHLTQHDSKNVGIVRSAIYSYESRGIKWDIPMLVNKTGLSQKVVKQTLVIASNSIRANIDDVGLTLKATIPTPEEDVIERELSAMLKKALRETLTDDEMHLFLARVNLSGRKELPYQTLAERMHMSVKDVKSKYSLIIAKLNNNEYLRSISPKKADAELPAFSVFVESTEDEDADFFAAYEAFSVNSTST